MPPSIRSVVRVGFLLSLLFVGTPSVLRGQALSDTLTFERARRLLLEHNPLLRASAARGRAMAQSARADALFPNPTISVSEERTNLEGDGVDDQWYLSIEQPLRYPGEHGARTDAAEATARAAEARSREVAADVYRTLRRRYLDVAVAEQRREIHRRFTEAVRRAARAARVRAEEGDLGTFRKARLQSARAEYENALAESERAARTAQTELHVLLHPESASDDRWGAERPSYVVSDTLQYRSIRVPEEAAVQRAFQARDRVVAARSAVEAEDERLTVARYERFPRLSVSAGPKSQSIGGSTTFGFTAALNVGLPLWNGGETNVDARRNRQVEAQAQLDAVRRAVRAEVQTALDDLDSYRSRIETVSDGILADTDSLLQNAQYVYREGEIRLFELLDALEAARSSELLRTRLTARYMRALYDLEYALGVGPDDAPVVVEGALRPTEPDLQ